MSLPLLVIGAFDVSGFLVHPGSGAVDGSWVELQEGAGDRLDHQTVAELCRSCGVELLASGSRWSVWFCSECKDRVRDLNDRVGECVIPIGRHSMMNGVALPGDQARDEDEVAAFVDKLQGFFETTTRLSDWAAEIIRRNCTRVGIADRDAVPIGEYLQAVSQLNREAAFEEMKVWWADGSEPDFPGLPCE